MKIAGQKVCGQQVAAHPSKEQGLLDILLLLIMRKARVPVSGRFKLRRLCDRARRWPGAGRALIERYILRFIQLPLQ